MSIEFQNTWLPDQYQTMSGSLAASTPPLPTLEEHVEITTYNPNGDVTSQFQHRRTWNIPKLAVVVGAASLGGVLAYRMTR